MDFRWKLGETFSDDWTWDEIKNCNPKAINWDWERISRGELYPLPRQYTKVLIVGSPQVGKSTLLWSYFDECDGPTVSVTACYDNCELHLHNMQENGVDIRAYLCDTSRSENFFQLGFDVYRDTKAIIFCYAVNDVQSLHDLFSSWIPLSRLLLGNVPSILVGNMVDTRNDIDGSQPQEGEFVTTAQGKLLQEIHEINRFYECSIEDGNTPQIIFQTALRLALRIER